MYFDENSAKMFEVDLHRDYSKVIEGTKKSVKVNKTKRSTTPKKKLLDPKSVPSIEMSSERVETALRTFEATSKKPYLDASGDIKRFREEIQSRSMSRQKKDGETTPRLSTKLYTKKCRT